MTLNGFANITKATFEDKPLKTYGKTVTRYAVTKVENYRGRITPSYAAGASITAILHRYKGEPKRIRNNEGMMENAAGYMMLSVDVTVAIGDKIKDTDSGEVFVIHTLENRWGVYQFADLFFLEDA